MGICKRCEQPLPAGYASPRRCAFESGVFSEDNWCCGTLMALRDHGERHRVRCGDESLMVIPATDGDDFLYCIMSIYKDRGCVQGMKLLDDVFLEWEPTLARVEDLLQNLEDDA